MCLMLYLGSSGALPLRRNEWLALEPLSKAAEVVRQHVRREYVYFVGSHSGCGCGFPCGVAEQVIDYYDGMFDTQKDSPERAKDIQSVRALLGVIDEALTAAPDCVLFPVWGGSEGVAPKGEVRWNRQQIIPEHFCLTEQFRCTVHAE
jgi:hypothetical protein